MNLDRVKITQFTNDPLNRVIQITDAISGFTRFSYDPNGNLLSVADAKGQITTYTYDSMDRLFTRTDSLLRREIYSYDLSGNLITFSDRKGQISRFGYDFLNRRISSLFDDGSKNEFVYDGAGRLTNVIDTVAGPIGFAYDSLDRLISEMTPQGMVAYSYDVLGRRTTMTANGLAPVTYQYDAVSRLTQVAQGSQVVRLGYDAAGRRTSLSYPNGVTTTYTHDQASRLSRILHQSVASTIEDLTYTYDAAGNRISFSRTGPQATLPAPVQAAYDAANEQIQFNSTTPNLSYDANGNLISKTDASGTTTYTWDARNRLIGIAGPSVSASFVYDALGRRISKTINGARTEYLYDGNDIVAEIGGGVVSATYLRSLNIDEPFVRQGSSNEYYHADALGSTLALTDQVGTAQTTYRYDPFGNTTFSGVASTNSFQYTGRENDEATYLYYLRARYYSSTLQRFISEDPLELAGGDANLYVYVLNNPMKWTDPLGLKLCATNLPGIGDTQLDDSVAPLVEDFIRRNTEDGIDVIFTEAFRTTEYQEALTRNPNAITPARPSTSLHEAGFGFDISWRRIPSEDRRTVVENARQAGLRWGGNFKKPDPVHFYKEVPGGRTKRSIYIKEAQGDFKKGNVPTCP